MRPIKLLMTAFGPYKDTEVIDFTELAGHNLFVISGNTGSGKTTIFDGISFALYGMASGSDRDNYSMLRSDFADDDIHTAVELEFSFKGRLFRILRQFGHVKEGNRSRTGEKYEFYEIIDGKEVPFVDRQIVSEINTKIEQLIGLTQDQFKQIVMLPQGEFRKLLTSQTENKEKILRRLFKTEPYKHISERLRENRSTVEKTFTQEEQTRNNYIQHISATLPEREDSPILQVLSEDHYNVNQVITGLEAEISFFKSEIEIDQRKYKQAYDTHNKKQTEYHQAKSLNERFDELAKQKERLAELEKQQPVFINKGKQLLAAEKANQIQPYESHAKERQKEEKDQSVGLDRAEKVKKIVDDKFIKVQAGFDEEEKKQPEREDVSRQLDRLNEFLPMVKEIDKGKQQLNEHKKKVEESFTSLTNITTKIKTLTDTLQTEDTQIKKLDEAVNQLPDKQQQLIDKREKATIVRDYLKLVDKQTKLNQHALTKKENLRKIKNDYTKLEQIWLTNQAGILAEHLHDGEACPVCGSDHHPHKASEQGKVVTRDELGLLKKVFDEKDEKYRTVVANRNANTNQLKEKEQELEPYELNRDHLRTALDELYKKGKKKKEAVEQLKLAREQLVQLRKKYDQDSKQLITFQTEAERTETTYQQQRLEYESKNAVFKERLRVVPEKVRVLSALKKQIQQTAELKHKLDKAWKEAQSNLQTAREEQTNASANVVNIQEQLKNAKSKREVAIEQFTEALAKANFETETHYREAKMEIEEQQELKKTIELFKQDFSTVAQQVKEQEKSLIDKKKMDISILLEQLEQLKKDYELALNAMNRSKEYYEEADQLKINIVESNKRVKEQEKKLGVITDLYDVVRGQNSQKISFERYLQIDYLEQIIDAANQRLKHLSNGQFLLIRSDRQESHGRQSGLAFDVYDAYTGQTRDVKTLSGGEKFNASLCLALGMSDVIQSFQGNISINTMFIDEGFGSLDEESLNKSIDTLIELQESGRMIGIISHVQELKTVFPAVLEVTKTQVGYSRTEFLIK